MERLALEARLVGDREERVVGIEGNGQGEGLSDGIEDGARIHIEPQDVSQRRDWVWVYAGRAGSGEGLMGGVGRRIS